MNKINVELDRHYFNDKAAMVHTVVIKVFPADGSQETVTEVLFAKAKSAEDYANGVKDALAMNGEQNERGGFVSSDGSIAHVTIGTKTLL